MSSLIPPIIWTVLPKYVIDNAYHFSVYVSFRLDDPSTDQLGDYIIQSEGPWPDLVAAMAESGGLEVQFTTGSSPAPVTIHTDLLDSNAWNALFNDQTFTSPFQFQDNTQRPLRSFSVMELQDYINGLYAQYANQDPAAFPNARAPGALNDLVKDLGTFRRNIDEFVGRNQFRNGPHPDAETEQMLSSMSAKVPLVAFYNAFRFYRRGDANAMHDDPPPVEVPTFDFHQVISALSDHPEILRMLGIVLDCSVPLDFVETLPGTADIRVLPRWIPDGSSGNDETPWTAYNLDIDRGLFRAAPRYPDRIMTEGVLNLANPDIYAVVQTDVDGDALKTMEYASGISNRDESPLHPPGEPLNESLPARRNGGFSVIRRRRDDALYDDLQAQASANSNPGGAVLYAEDILRGYRVDIEDDSRWYSLCQRDTNYVLGHSDVELDIRDEGYVKAASASSQEGAPDMYVHETLFGWDNWSLVTERPGAGISYDHNDDGTQQIAIRKEESTPPEEFPFRPTTRVVPGTLPKLRFGRKYALRARCVDLAGFGLSIDDAAQLEDDGRSLTYPYLRHEPIAPPVLVMRGPITLAESVEHLVVRTRVGDPIANFDENKYFNPSCSRFVAAPKATQTMAELHGMFDDIWNDYALAYSIATREAGTFNDPTTALLYEGEELYDGTGSFPAGYVRGDPLPQSEEGLHVYVVQPGSTLDLPYLPDPLALGLVFDGLPGWDIFDAQWFYAGVDKWPDVSPFHLTLITSNTSKTDVQPVSGGLEVSVPIGEMLRVRYSSATDASVKQVMAVFSQMTSQNQNIVADRGYQHWMLTPWRELTFVHAVEKPVNPSDILKLSDSRQRGDTFVNLQGTYRLQHVPSTGKVDLVAEWDDWDDLFVDEPTGVVITPRTGHVAEHQIAYDSPSQYHFPEIGAIPRQEFGDTKHRIVTYKLVSTTRYREYFPPELYEQKQLITRDDGEQHTLSIPSSERPDPPHLLYLIPTFRWNDTASGRQRFGGGLRVYLDRPWFSSGEGEQLAIVLRPSGSVSQDVLQYTSEWGADPAFEGNAAPSRLTTTHFRTTADSNPSTSPDRILAELEDQGELVPLVTFEPEFDSERQLWFVDLELDPLRMYTPFVRLVFARHQPQSLTGLHLSTTVRAHFMQLQPDRAATYSLSPDETRLTITVSGLATLNDAGKPKRGGLINPTPSRSVALTPSEDTLIDAIDVSPEPSPEPIGVLTPNPSVGRGRLVTAQIQRLADPAADELGWTQETAEIALPSHTETGSLTGTVVWKASLTMPSTYPSQGTHRVMIREYEVFETDSEVGETLPSGTSYAPYARRRLVYADAFEL